MKNYGYKPMYQISCLSSNFSVFLFLNLISLSFRLSVYVNRPVREQTNVVLPFPAVCYAFISNSTFSS